MSDHWVYVIYAAETQRMKIGRSATERGCHDRLKACQTGSPVRLYMVATLEPGSHPGESAIHAELAQWRNHGEWFSTQRHTIIALECLIGFHRLNWPTITLRDEHDTEMHFIESEGVYVDRPPIEVVFRHRHDGHERRGYLYVGYEIDYESITDDYEPADCSAWVLYDMWRDWARLRDIRSPDESGIHINWYVAGCATFDLHPTAIDPYQHIDGLERWSHWFHDPRRTDGQSFRWNDLPVAVKRWHRDYPATKGGFIEEYTGFRPSPLQPYVTLAQLEALTK